MEADTPLLSIGEVAARSGVAASALRFYESLGLIDSVRQGSSRRYFPRAALRRIAFIVFAQRIGYSLEEIGEEVRALPAGKAPSKADWQRMTRDWRARVREKIEELQRLDMDLQHCIGCGCLSMDHCKLSNPEDKAAAAGTGPRFWIDGPPATGSSKG